MTDAEKAYAEALRVIEEATQPGNITSSLAFELPALERIPDEINACFALATLVLSDTQVTDLSPLATLPALARLDLTGTKVTDLSPLATLPALASLDLVDTQVTDLSPLSGLTTLRRLDLSGTPVNDLSNLANLPALATLILLDTQVADLFALANLPALASLDLAGTQVTDLSPLATLPALASLDVEDTQVTDLSSLAGLTTLGRLDLARTPVKPDGLRNLARLHRLVSGPGPKGFAPEFQGLRFTNTAAAREDPRIAEIAQIGDPSPRARTLFEYLGLPVDGDTGPPPEPDPLLPSVIVNGRLEVAPDVPSEAERDDAVKRAVHTRLAAKAADLAALARNRLPRLNRRAQALHGLLDRPFDTLDLLAVHFEVEDLNHRAARGAEDGEAFGDEVDEALADIARLGPGLTRDHAQVEIHEERLARTRAAPPLPEAAAARAALSRQILVQPQAHGPRSLAIEATMADASDPTRADAIRHPKHRNMLWRLGVTAATLPAGFASGVAASHVANVFGPEITAFVSTNWQLLVAVAQTYGASFATWFVGTVGAALMGKGAMEEWRKRRRDGD